MHHRLEEEEASVSGPGPFRPEKRAAEAADRRVALEKVGDCEVSTVFLGVAGGGGPDRSASVILGGRLDDVTVRCRGTQEEASAMHARVVEHLRGLLKAMAE